MRAKLVFTFLFFICATGLCHAKGKKTLLVADRKAACAGTFECIQIKEKDKAPWRFYSDTIEGFNYEEGYEYKISVQPLQTKNTLSGLYEEKYKLLKVVSKKKTSYNPSQGLADKKWILKSMFDTKRTLKMSDTSISIQFNLSTGKVNGRGLCNSFFASFTCQGTKMLVTNFGATKMMCTSEEFENVIFKFYKATTTFKIQDNTLTLSQPDGSDMVFEGY